MTCTNWQNAPHSEFAATSIGTYALSDPAGNCMGLGSDATGNFLYRVSMEPCSVANQNQTLALFQLSPGAYQICLDV